MMDFGVSYFESRRLEHVKKDMEELERIGMTYVVHTMSELDWENYHGMFDGGTRAGSTMRAIVRATRDAGLKAWIDPWSVGYVFGADAYSQFVVTHPEASQHDQHGAAVPGACPNQPAFRTFMHDWIEAAVSLEPDMIFWDEPHLYWGGWFGAAENRWGCCCTLCQSLYRERFGGPMPKDQQDPSVRLFRDDTVVDLLRDMFGYARRCGTKNALTLLPSVEGFDGSRPLVWGPDWETVAALPGLDNLGTDPYLFPLTLRDKDGSRLPPTVPDWRPYIASHADLVVDLCRRHGLDNHFWIQGFSVPADDLGYVSGAMRLAAERGITNLAVWGFDGHRDMSHFSCEQPDKVWNRIKTSIRELHEG